MSETTTRTLAIEGMTCQSCVANIREALEEVAGVQAASVDLASGRARVTTTGPIPVENLCAVVEGAGKVRAREA